MSNSSTEDLKWREQIAKIEFDRYQNAEKIDADNWNGVIVWNDQFYDSIEEAFEDHDLPEYVWAAKNIGIPRIDPENILWNVLDRMWEEAELTDLNGVEELRNAINKFNEANKSIEVWAVDYKKAIVLDKSVLD